VKVDTETQKSRFAGAQRSVLVAITQVGDRDPAELIFQRLLDRSLTDRTS